MDNKHDPREDTQEYGFMERELIFKLLAAHALVDEEFFNQLRIDPATAAEQLHIHLTENDIIYIRDTVEWDFLISNAGDIRQKLHLDMVTNSW